MCYKFQNTSYTTSHRYPRKERICVGQIFFKIKRKKKIPNEKLIFEVGRIDKTYKVISKYLRLDKKSPEFDKAFYKAIRKNKDTRFLISNAGYKQWGDCEKIKTRTDYSLPTEQESSNKIEFKLF